MQIILLRGINVGGHNSLSMDNLARILTRLGASWVETYIQSGNAVIAGAHLSAAAISDAIAKEFGFRPQVLALDVDAYERIVAANPFPEAEAEGKTLHVWFPDGALSFDDAAAREVAADSERFAVAEGAIFLHAPDGIGRSKLAERMERFAGVPLTARNWNTVRKLLELAR